MSNRPRTGVVLSVLAQGTLAALVGMTLGCGGRSPVQPTPTPVTPAATPTVTAVYAVTASTNTVAPGDPLSVSWTASTAGGNDWIALFKKGDPNTAHGWWTGWTEGATSGTFMLSAPTQAGQYEFRYLLDDGFSAAAQSSSVTVAAVPPAPDTVAGERWNLTTTLRSATGPKGCVVDISHMHVGWSSDWLMTIERTRESIHLVVSDVGDPTDRYEYEGTVVADVLTVLIKSFSGAGWCGERGGRVEFRAEHHVSGRFSADGHALTAEEVVSLHLNSGETLSLHYDWSATRP